MLAIYSHRRTPGALLDFVPRIPHRSPRSLGTMPTGILVPRCLQIRPSTPRCTCFPVLSSTLLMFRAVDDPTSVFLLSALADLTTEQRRDPDIFGIMGKLASSSSDRSLRNSYFRKAPYIGGACTLSGLRCWLSFSGIFVPPLCPSCMMYKLLIPSGNLLRTSVFGHDSFGLVYTDPSAAMSLLANYADRFHPLNILSERVYHGVDLLRLCLTSDSGNKWITVATHCTTRFPITRARPTLCATDAAELLLEDTFLHHGTPRHLLADRGIYYITRVVDDLLRSCLTKHKLNTANHPQMN